MKSDIKDKNLWIAKLPSKTDTTDNAAWEFLTYKLATASGIPMANSRIKRISGVAREPIQAYCHPIRGTKSDTYSTATSCKIA